MRHTWIYGFTAILLGISMVGLPFMLLPSDLESDPGNLDPSGASFSRESCTKSYNTQDGGTNEPTTGEVIAPLGPFSSLGLLLVPSFLVALGISFFVKKKRG